MLEILLLNYVHRGAVVGVDDDLAGIAYHAARSAYSVTCVESQALVCSYALLRT
jgi:hypothetical protein